MKQKQIRTDRNAGFSLLELLIAMTVTITVLGITSTLIAGSFRIRLREDRRSDAIADAQRAINIMSREIATSGFGLVDNGIVPGDTSTGSIRFRTNLNAYRNEAGSSTVSEQDEDVKYQMYDDEEAGRHYLVRFDVNKGGANPKDGITVLANRLDSLDITYYNSAGATLDVDTDPSLIMSAVRLMITVSVTLPEEGTPGSDNYQPASQTQLVSEVVLRNANQLTY